jgi:two-component system sensor histidine kinase HydH
MLTKAKKDRFWAGIPPWMEKGAALIRSFEAGTRTGMGMHWSAVQLQKLLTETAQQPDILYLLVADANGKILAHGDPEHIGRNHGRRLNLTQIARSKKAQWRLLPKPDGKKIFEVFRRFSPAEGPLGMRRGRMMMQNFFWLRATELPEHHFQG